MRVDLIAIGNSKGVRLPKALLAQCGFTASAELEIRDGELVLRPVATPRQRWAEAARELAENPEPRLLDDAPTAFDDSEWTW